MADQPASLAEALARFQASLPTVTKNATAEVKKDGVLQYSYEYANLATTNREVLTEMGKLGLSFSCKPTVRKGEFGLRYKLRLAGTSEVEKGWWPLPKAAPQQVGSAMTYYRRYILNSLVGTAADEDDDDGARAQHAPPPSREQGRGGQWMNRRPDVPPKDLQDRRTPTRTTGSEHEQLRTGTVEATPDDRPAKRARGQAPEGDPWLDQPPGTFEETPPEERTGSIDGRQRSQIFAKLALLGITDAAAQRETLAGVLRRPVSSRASLSYRDAEAVLKDLQGRVEAKDAAEAAQQAAAEQDAAEVDAP